MNWSQMPYMRVALVFMTGIWCLYDAEIQSTVLLYVLLSVFLLCIVSEYIHRKNYTRYTSALNGAWLLLAVFILGGFFSVRQAEELAKNRYYSESLTLNTWTVSLQGQLKSRKGKRFQALLTHISDSTGTVTSTGGINMMLQFSEKDSVAYSYRPGDRITCRGHIRTIQSNTNPEAFDYARFLYFQGVVLQSYIKPGNHVWISAQEKSLWTFLIMAMKDYGQATLDKYMSETVEKGIVEALLLGQRTHLDEQLYQTYADTGAVHVLAVSGLHVGIFISIFLALFSKIKYRSLWMRITKVITLSGLVALYVLFTGASPSVIRAGIMVSLVILGKTFFSRGSVYNIMALAALVMLMWNPFFLFQTSFQFSYLALLGIIYFQPGIFALYAPSQKIVKAIWGLVSVSVAAQIFIFPFTLYYFHQFPVYFAVSSLVAIPLVTCIIYLGLLLMLSEAFLTSISPFLADTLVFIVRALNQSMTFIREWPVAVWKNIWLSDTSLMLSVAFFLSGILWYKTRDRWAFRLSLLCLLAMVADDSLRYIRTAVSRQVTVYNTFEGTCADVMNGPHHYTFSTGGISDQTEERACGNLRMKNRFRPGENLNRGLVRVGEKLVYFYGDKDDFKKLRKDIPVSILVVTSECVPPPEHIISSIMVDTVILPSDLKPGIRKKWLNLPREKQIFVYDVKTHGAYHTTFTSIN